MHAASYSRRPLAVRAAGGSTPESDQNSRISSSKWRYPI